MLTLDHILEIIESASFTKLRKKDCSKRHRCWGPELGVAPKPSDVHLLHPRQWQACIWKWDSSPGMVLLHPPCHTFTLESPESPKQELPLHVYLWTLTPHPKVVKHRKETQGQMCVRKAGCKRWPQTPWSLLADLAQFWGHKEPTGKVEIRVWHESTFSRPSLEVWDLHLEWFARSQPCCQSKMVMCLYHRDSGDKQQSVISISDPQWCSRSPLPCSDFCQWEGWNRWERKKAKVTHCPTPHIPLARICLHSCKGDWEIQCLY